jgi:hypothetical protein
MTDHPEPTPPAPPLDIELRRGAIGALKADDLNLTVGAIGAARADRATVEFGAVGALAAGDASVTMSAVGTVAALDARVSQALVRSVVARDVHFARGSGAAVVFAARVDGEPTILLDWRGGLAAGTIVALVWLIVRRLR